MKKKYILFDHDGVLVDTEQWYFEANRRALSGFGIDLEMTVYLDIMINGRSCLELLNDSGLQESQVAEVRKVRNRYYQEYLKTENIEIPGVEDVLKELSGTYKMAVVTTSTLEAFQLIHENRNLMNYMEFVLTREDYKNSKPHPEPYLSGLERIGGLPQETIIVEDSQRGLRSAVSAGIECVIVYNEFTKSHDFTQATHCIDSLSELPSILKKWGDTV